MRKYRLLHKQSYLHKHPPPAEVDEPRTPQGQIMGPLHSPPSIAAERLAAAENVIHDELPMQQIAQLHNAFWNAFHALHRGSSGTETPPPAEMNDSDPEIFENIF